MKTRKFILSLGALLSVLALAAGCGKDENVSFDDPSNTSSITKPVLDTYLTTTTQNDVSLRVRFNNGGDTSGNMACVVHWRAYASKPASTPKASDMNKHESMRQQAATKTKTTFDKTHTGFSGGNYVYYYFECSNSKYTTITNVTYCIVKR